jgi:hypothetical protein
LKQRSGSTANLISKLGRSASNLLKRSGSGKLSSTSTTFEPTQGIESLAYSIAKCASSPHDHIAIVQLGFIPPIVNMIKVENSDAISLLGCRALAHLASRREHLCTIVELGAVDALLRLLANDSPSLALGALEALRPLSRDSTAKAALRELACVRLLTKIVGKACTAESTAEDKGVAEAALGVLRNLSASAESQDVLKSAGTMKVLVTALDAMPFEVYSSAAVRAATTLSNLVVGHQANKNEVRKYGAIPKLVGLLSSNDGEVRAAATEALGNLAVKNAANKDAIRDAGGVHVIAQMYKAATGCGPTKGPHSHSSSRPSSSARATPRGTPTRE